MWTRCVLLAVWIHLSHSHDLQAPFKCTGGLPTDAAGLGQHARLLGECARGKTAACDALNGCELYGKHIIALSVFLCFLL